MHFFYKMELNDHKFKVEDRIYLESYTLDDTNLSISIREYYLDKKRKEDICYS